MKKITSMIIPKKIILFFFMYNFSNGNTYASCDKKIINVINNYKYLIEQTLIENHSAENLSSIDKQIELNPSHRQHIELEKLTTELDMLKYLLGINEYSLEHIEAELSRIEKKAKNLNLTTIVISSIQDIKNIITQLRKASKE